MVHPLKRFGVRCLYGAQRHTVVVVHINDADPEDLLATLHLAGDAGPELAYPRRFLSGLGEKAWIHGNGKQISSQSLSDQMLVEG